MRARDLSHIPNSCAKCSLRTTNAARAGRSGARGPHIFSLSFFHGAQGSERMSPTALQWPRHTPAFVWHLPGIGTTSLLQASVSHLCTGSDSLPWDSAETPLSLRLQVLCPLQGDMGTYEVAAIDSPGNLSGDQGGEGSWQFPGKAGAAATWKSAEQKNVCCWPEPKDGAPRPQWIVFMKAAIKGKWGLLRKLEGTQPWLLAML